MTDKSTKNQKISLAKRKLVRGFTLVELIVAIGIFSIVMLIAVGALLSMINANRKAQALKLVMNNINFAMENMVKDIRVGTTYHADITSGSITSPQDGVNASSFAFEKSGGDPDTSNDQVAFRLSGGSIERSNDGTASWTQITSSDVNIEELGFNVYGSDSLDQKQPRVAIVLRGNFTLADGTEENFSIQTSMTQRLLD